MEWSTMHLVLVWIFLSMSGKQVFSANQQLKRVTTIISTPYLMLSEGEETKSGNDRYVGYCADLVKELAQIAGFNYTIQLVKDGKYGGQEDNGTWNGMIGELIRQEADLAVAPLVITSARERVVDFSKPFMSTGIGVMLKKPSTMINAAELATVFLSPFPVEVWIGLPVSCLTIGFIMFLLARFNPVETHQSTRSEVSSGDVTAGDVTACATPNAFNLSNSFWFSAKTMLQQGTHTDPRSVSCRFLSAVWWMFAVVVMTVYTANLAAIVINSKGRMLVPIGQLEDLAEQTEIRYGALQSGSTKHFFQTSQIPVYKKMYDAMSADPSVFVKTTDEGVQRVRESNGRYAFLTDSPTIAYANQQSPCDTMKIGDNIDVKGFGIATPHGSELRSSVGMAVLTMLEGGQLDKLYRKWWEDKEHCFSRLDQGQRLVNISGAFYVLIAGVAIAAIAAVIEVIYWRRQSTKPAV